MQVCIHQRQLTKASELSFDLDDLDTPRSNLTTSEDSQPMISYMLVSHCKPPGSIISELYALLKSATWGTLALRG